MSDHISDVDSDRSSEEGSKSVNKSGSRATTVLKDADAPDPANANSSDGDSKAGVKPTCTCEKYGILKFWLYALRSLILLFLTVATITTGVVAGITVYRTYFAIPDEIEVPVIQGKDMREVNALLKSMGLRLRLGEGKYSNKFPEQIIISQDPAPGDTVRRDREVIAVISLGPELMTVPDLSGKSKRDAEILLAENKLQLGKVKEVEKEGVKTSQIVSQKPQAGARVKRGTPINIDVNISSTMAGVVVPDWTGKNIATAQALINKAGLRLGRITWSPSGKVQQGMIISQSPPYGAEVAMGSDVELELSAGPAEERMMVQRMIDVALPSGSDSHDVRIVLVSSAGEQEVYRARQIVGEHLRTWVSGCASADIEIYVNDNIVKRDKL